MHLMEAHMRTALPLGFRRPLFGMLGKLYPMADWARRVFRAKTTFEALAPKSVEAYFHSMSLIRDLDTEDPLALIQYIDAHAYIVGDISTKVDRASMAHLLEVREPLIDHCLFAWLSTLPYSIKLRGNEGKLLLKKAMEPQLRNDVLYRPKMGFAVHLPRWFRGPLRERVRSSLLDGHLADSGWFDQATSRRVIEQHENGSRDHSTPLWTLLMYDASFRNVMR